MKDVVVGNLKSKTSLLGLALIVLGGLDQSGALTQLLDLIPVEYRGTAVSLFGALMLFLRNITNTSIAEKGAPKQGGFAHIGMLLTLAIAAAVLLSGCANNQAQEITYRIGTRQAVQRYIWDAGTDAKRSERASRINAGATALKAVATGDAVTLAQLREAAYREIARHKSLIPPDVELLRDLVDAVVEFLEGEVGAGVLDPNQVLRVSEVLDWVAGAAVYTPIQPS